MRTTVYSATLPTNLPVFIVRRPFRTAVGFVSS